ncbi:MAG: RNA methyltransferase [Polyangiaceae bacterium]|nr:RNA methyltransferase [Polyangiaceae bacterium]MCW5790975.1 RNA methyltransferase [Polyangiaceae bacterium]
MRRRVAAALIHYPVLDRAGGIVTSAITNLDLHDIARSAFTFGLTDYFVVHPVAAQRELALRVRAHWVEGAGGRRIPDRVPPMSALRVVASVDDAIDELRSADGQPPELWTTSARRAKSSLSYQAARGQLQAEGPSVLLVFGTGWGLAPELEARATARLEPIESPREDGFNHLSVRAAAAITFARLLG